MSKFYNLRVVEIRRETVDSVSLLLESLSGETFHYKAGQYLTLRTTIDGEDLRRSYSLCSAPYEGILRVAVKEVPGGKFSAYANRVLAVGDVLESMLPDGRFTAASSPNENNHLGFAAGSGITPIMSIIKETLHASADARFALFYVNKETASIIFKEELADLKDIYLERLQIFNLLTREPVEIEMFGGRLDRARFDRIFTEVISPSSYDVSYLCGPEEMILAGKDALLSAGMDESKIKFELFTTSSPAKEDKVQASNTSSSSDHVNVAVVLDGVTTTVSVKRTGKSILEVALDAGLDAPFSCQGGVCCSCRCKMTSGSVEMDVNYALEPDEVENGYVLACQSHPVGDGPFVMDFDQP
ncbi:MAG: 2Fe-2S iron-sulfur cluster-binding protein [Bacteroidetes bacterium]|jgi:ring-1,2-phenylacetyl-CoA epoxidase subunit PaaE|nr:2Fe-2S iron-sulfur cluster-binding protein [Bacteroidota bacterium]